MELLITFLAGMLMEAIDNARRQRRARKYTPDIPSDPYKYHYQRYQDYDWKWED